MSIFSIKVVIIRSSSETTDFDRLVMYVGLHQSLSRLNTTFLESAESSHSVLPLSDQQLMD